MPAKDHSLEQYSDLVPHFATRAEIAELREKIISLQTLVRARAAQQGADARKLEEWALCMGQFNSEPGRAIVTAQQAADSLPAERGHAPTDHCNGGGGAHRTVPHAPK